MAADPMAFARERIAEAIGGREKALSFEKRSDGRFKRKTLQSWIDGDTSPGLAELVDLAHATGRDWRFFFPHELESPETIEIQKLDVRVAAGGGAFNSGHPANEPLVFPMWMARKLSKNVGRLRFLRATGDSMLPVIRNGALLLVDERDRELPTPPPRPKNEFDHPDIYVFSQGDDLRVKRLRLTPKGDILVLSDNRAFDPETLDKRDRQGFKIHGRVVWWDNRL